MIVTRVGMYGACNGKTSYPDRYGRVLPRNKVIRYGSLFDSFTSAITGAAGQMIGAATAAGTQALAAVVPPILQTPAPAPQASTLGEVADLGAITALTGTPTTRTATKITEKEEITDDTKITTLPITTEDPPVTITKVETDDDEIFSLDKILPLLILLF